MRAGLRASERSVLSIRFSNLYYSNRRLLQCSKAGYPSFWRKSPGYWGKVVAALVRSGYVRTENQRLTRVKKI